MITSRETFFLKEQSVRIELVNELGHVVADITLPLVVTVDGETRPFDIDKIVNEHIEFHENRHKVFVQAAQKRGHIAAETAAVAPVAGEKDCGCQ